MPAKEKEAQNVKKVVYYIYASLTESDGDEKRMQFESEQPFVVPPVGAPFQILFDGATDLNMVGKVGELRYSYEYDPKNKTLVCNTNIGMSS